MEVNQIFLRRFYEIFNLGFELYISGGDFSLRHMARAWKVTVIPREI